jgi:uncharacterized membrane protein YqiK
VAEISSDDSRAEDRGKKLRTYRDVLQCEEYLIYDVPREELLLYRRQGGKYVSQQPDAQGRYWSATLGCFFGRDRRTLLRVYSPDGKPIEQFEELKDAAERWAGIAARLQQEMAELRARSAQERREAMRLLAIEQERAEAAQAQAQAEREQARSALAQAQAQRARTEAERERAEAAEAEAAAERKRADAERERAELLEREVEQLRAVLAQQSETPHP